MLFIFQKLSNFTQNTCNYNLLKIQIICFLVQTDALHIIDFK